MTELREIAEEASKKITQGAMEVMLGRTPKERPSDIIYAALLRAETAREPKTDQQIREIAEEAVNQISCTKIGENWEHDDRRYVYKIIESALLRTKTAQEPKEEKGDSPDSMTAARNRGINAFIEILSQKLKKASAGEYQTWGFVQMFMDMMDESKKELSGNETPLPSTQNTCNGQKESTLDSLQRLLHGINNIARNGDIDGWGEPQRKYITEASAEALRLHPIIFLAAQKALVRLEQAEHPHTSFYHADKNSLREILYP